MTREQLDAANALVSEIDELDNLSACLRKAISDKLMVVGPEHTYLNVPEPLIGDVAEAVEEVIAHKRGVLTRRLGDSRLEVAP